MAVTVDTIQSRVAAVVDQDENTSNLSTTDYSLRLNYINRRERMWSEIGKWQCLYKEYNTLTSTSTGNTSVSLPADFRFLASFPKITYDGITTEEFTEIKGQEEGGFNQSSDPYIKILSGSNGYVMKVNVPTTTGELSSGASIYVPYFSTPASLASPSDNVACPNIDYLIQGCVADVWEAREDARFQQAKIEANQILQNMIEFENTPSQASYNDRVRAIEQTRHNFRIGRD